MPTECRTLCDLPPDSALQREEWELEVFTWGAQCAALHKDCVENSK